MLSSLTLWPVWALAAGALVVAPVSVGVGWGLQRSAQAFTGRPVALGWMVGGAFLVLLGAPLLPMNGLWSTALLGWTLVVLAAVDIQVLRLPDRLTWPLALAGLAFAGGRAPLAERLVGCVIGFAGLALVDRAYVRLRGRQGVGLGDAKLFGAAGAWLGWRALPGVLLIACAAGLVWVACRLLRRGRGSMGAAIPFGPALALAFWLQWLSG
jgi:leader peptidase (prepilin peptidase) / N-methyltransferase